MENRMFRAFRWTFGKFSDLDFNTVFSEHFSLDGHPWCVYFFFPKWRDGEVMIGFGFAGDEFPAGSRISINIELTFVNQLLDQGPSRYEFDMEFRPSKAHWQWRPFRYEASINDPPNGFMVNDSFAVKVYVKINQSDHGIVESAVSSLKLVDYIGSCYNIAEDFIPLLERVFFKHPTLADSLTKRSPEFIEWACTTLGSILHFLSTVKKKDIDDNAHNHLLSLWNELKISQLDVTWLRPRVEDALSMREYAQRVMLKTQEEKVANIEMEMQTIKEMIERTGKHLEEVTSKLTEAKEGYVEQDLDAELGYGD